MGVRPGCEGRGQPDLRRPPRFQRGGRADRREACTDRRPHRRSGDDRRRFPCRHGGSNRSGTRPRTHCCLEPVHWRTAARHPQGVKGETGARGAVSYTFRFQGAQDVDTPDDMLNVIQFPVPVAGELYLWVLRFTGADLDWDDSRTRVLGILQTALDPSPTPSRAETSLVTVSVPLATEAPLSDSADTATITSHGLTVSDRVRVKSLVTTTGLTNNNVYWVVSPTQTRSSSPSPRVDRPSTLAPELARPPLRRSSAAGTSSVLVMELAVAAAWTLMPHRGHHQRPRHHQHRELGHQELRRLSGQHCHHCTHRRRTRRARHTQRAG